MKNEYEELCESLITTLKQTKTMRYPKQIRLSEEFMEALRKEIGTHKEFLDESKRPIKDLSAKFLKALKFELSELN